MTYVAFGPLGPRIAVAVSRRPRRLARLGPVQFGYDPELDVDLNLYPNKDAVFFPEPMPGPGGEPCYAMLHRPMWDQTGSVSPAATRLPAGDRRAAGHLDLVRPGRPRRRRRPRAHARPRPPLRRPAANTPTRAPRSAPVRHPMRVPRAGCSSTTVSKATSASASTRPGRALVYSAGAMLLDPDDPSRVIARTAEPLLEPETLDERVGTVPNVVFPTAIATIDGAEFVFYGMADSSIGVALLERTRA